MSEFLFFHNIFKLKSYFFKIRMALKTLFTGAQPKAGTGHKMQTLSVVFLTLHCCEYLERQIYERLLNSEPSIAKLIWNKSYDIYIYYSTIASFYHIWSRERAKYETVIHCSVPV